MTRLSIEVSAGSQQSRHVYVARAVPLPQWTRPQRAESLGADLTSSDGDGRNGECWLSGSTVGT